MYVYVFLIVRLAMLAVGVYLAVLLARTLRLVIRACEKYLGERD